MKVLAVGAAGSSAGLVVRALRDQRIEVRGLVHSTDKEGIAQDNGASETVVADLLDRDALRAAVDGCDGVFHVIPAFAADEPNAGVALVQVAEQAGIRRFVFSSVYQPSLSSLSNHRNKQPAEEALFTSSMEFTILQPAMFMSQVEVALEMALRGGVITGPYSKTSKMAYVDYHDVAEVAAHAFTTDRFVNGTFELSAEGEYSREDIAQILGELLERSVRAEQSALRLPKSIPDEMRDGLTHMFEHYDKSGLRGGNSLVLATMLGREPLSVRDYLRRAMNRRSLF